MSFIPGAELCKYGPEVDSIEPRSSLHGKMSQNGAPRLSPKLAKIPSISSVPYSGIESQFPRMDALPNYRYQLGNSRSSHKACKRKSGARGFITRVEAPEIVS